MLTCFSVATFTPGDDNKQCWLSKHCESPGATNHTSITGGKDISAERWKALCTDSAWDAAITYWKGRRDFDEDGFSSEMSNFFHGTPNFYCGSLASANGCRSFFQCLRTYILPQRSAEIVVSGNERGAADIECKLSRGQGDWTRRIIHPQRLCYHEQCK